MSNISTIIAKPTKECNADCTYCSAPPYDANKWGFDQFKVVFDRLEPGLTERATWIWHGGEPLLLSPDFYKRCYDYAKKKKPNIRFSVQTNLLLYKTKRWKQTFEEVFESRVSSSFDPDERNRTIKGSTAKYSSRFYEVIEEVLADGFRPLVIGTYTEDTIHFAHKMYDYSKSFGENAFNLRYNYRYPAGRASEEGVAISPKTYGEMLIALWDRLITEIPSFDITPLDQMCKKVIGIESSRCPWTRKCGGRFLGIEPNGDIYNCSDFADIGAYKYGNVFQSNITSKVKNLHTQVIPVEFVKKAVNTHSAKLMKRRQYNLPVDCVNCRHFNECEGGCMRDAELYGRGLGGKFFYCQSWMMVFDRIKSDIISGKADAFLTNRNISLTEARREIIANSRNDKLIEALA